MRQVKIYEFGGPEVLRIEDLPLGTLDRHHVRLKIKAIGLNRAEAMLRAGQVPGIVPPFGLGLEASGVVEAVGDKVVGWSVGECATVLPSFGVGYATYAESCDVPADLLLPQPYGLTHAQGAALWASYITAYGAVVEAVSLCPGDVIVITGATSGVGLAAIQIARMCGVTVIAVTRSVGKAAMLRATCADKIVVDNGDTLVASVRTAADGNPIRAALDTVAGMTLPSLVELLADDGILLSVGALDPRPAIFPVMPAIIKGLSLKTIVAARTMNDPERRKQAVAFILNGVEKGILRPHIDRCFALSSIADAHGYLDTGNQTGKIVAVP